MKFRRLKADYQLFESEYLSIYSTDDDRYTYCHESKASMGKKVALLPFFMTNDGEMKFLGRFEKFHRSLDIGLCSITGSVEITEDSPSIEHSAQRELLEEAGVKCSLEELIYLGECITSKSMDTIVHLYAVKLHEDLDYSTPEGDGTLDESRAWCEICSAEDLTDSYDPLLSIMLSRLLERLSANV